MLEEGRWENYHESVVGVGETECCPMCSCLEFWEYYLDLIFGAIMEAGKGTMRNYMKLLHIKFGN